MRITSVLSRQTIRQDQDCTGLDVIMSDSGHLDLKDELDNKMIYLEMIIDRLDTLLEYWNSKMELNSEFAIRILEYTMHCQNIIKILELNKIPSGRLDLIWKVLDLVLEPLWDLNDQMLSLFGELDFLYTELRSFTSSEKQQEKDWEIVNQITRLKELKDCPNFIRNGNLRIFESVKAGKAMVATLKEHCSRLMTLKSLHISQSSDLLEEIKKIVLVTLSQSQKHQEDCKKWINTATTNVEIMKFKAEDALADL